MKKCKINFKHMKMKNNNSGSLKEKKQYYLEQIYDCCVNKDKFNNYDVLGNILIYISIDLF